MALAFEPGSIDHLSQVISHVVAPAFLLGGVAGFTSILLSRLGGVIDRIRSINEVPDTGHAKSRLKADLPRLRRRAALLQRSLFLTVCSGIAAAILIIAAFGAALLGTNHAWGAAVLFIMSMVLLCAGFVLFAMEIRIGLNEHDNF